MKKDSIIRFFFFFILFATLFYFLLLIPTYILEKYMAYPDNPFPALWHHLYHIVFEKQVLGKAPDNLLFEIPDLPILIVIPVNILNLAMGYRLKTNTASTVIYFVILALSIFIIIILGDYYNILNGMDYRY